jgi:hypothetical protein
VVMVMCDGSGYDGGCGGSYDGGGDDIVVMWSCNGGGDSDYDLWLLWLCW